MWRSSRKKETLLIGIAVVTAGKAYVFPSGPWIGRRQQHFATTTSDERELAAATLALLRGDAPTWMENRGDVLRRVFEREESFEALAVALIEEVAKTKETAAAETARRILDDPERLEAMKREIGAEFKKAADGSDVKDVQKLLDAIRTTRRKHELFPENLRSLDKILGDLQLLPPACDDDCELREEEWHAKVPGDGHVLRRWASEKLSVVGIGKSADASAYYVPELGIVFDAGLAVKSFVPKTVLLTHGHRDHIQALPTLARRPTFDGRKSAALILVPTELESLVRNFLQAEAELNFGHAQSREETDAYLGPLDILPVRPGDDIALPKQNHLGPPLGVQVYGATHKPGIPAVAFGLYTSKRRVKPEFQGKDSNFFKDHDRNEFTEVVKDYLIFYSGDTTINLLKFNHPEILTQYKYIIHECTFVGTDTSVLDHQCQTAGHTHYLQLHPIIAAHPDTTFILAHFSTRYSRADVLDFFLDAYGGVPHNVVLWV